MNSCFHNTVIPIRSVEYDAVCAHELQRAMLSCLVSCARAQGVQ
jgi:hypothetical protein